MSNAYGFWITFGVWSIWFTLVFSLSDIEQAILNTGHTGQPCTNQAVRYGSTPFMVNAAGATGAAVKGSDR